MSAQRELRSERLTLRPLSLDDAEAMHLIYADPETVLFSSHASHSSFDETVDRLTKAVESTTWRSWAVTLANANDAIGVVVANERRQGRVFEIGYTLARSHWGHGYGSEAVTRLITHLFVDESARRIFADTDPDNIASNRLLERLGFSREGRLRAEWETHIGVRDSYIWGLLAEEWAARDFGLQ
ncbi:MAG: GNAT family N-acetyltransferase [Sphingomonas sp.]